MTTPIAFISNFIAPSTAKWQLLGNTQSFTSPLVGTTQTAEMPGARWYGSVQFDPLDESQWRQMEAWLAQLVGASGRFYYGPPHAKVPRGVATGAPVVNGGAQTGRTLTTGGWTASQTGILKAGDYFSFDSGTGRELKIVTADANSDGSGNATVSFSPPIRTSPDDGATLTVQSPTCIMRLKDDMQGANQLTPPLLGGVEFEFIEAF